MSSYHHGNLRQRFVEAASQVVDQQGVDGLSMRSLARQLGVSSAAPFRHFSNKQELLDAIAERAGAEVDRRLEEAITDGDDALTRCRAMTVAYVRYAAEHPALFDLIQSRESARGRFLGAVDDERRLKLIALIVEGQNAGLIPEAEPELVALTHEALTHGLARMIAERHPRVARLSSEDARKLALAVTQLLQRGIGLS